MPTLARWHIKTGLIFFAVGLVLGVVLAAQPVFNFSPLVTLFYPVFLHLLIVGWITQLIIGVAYWMFPKLSKAQPRGSQFTGWCVYVLLNIGLILRAIGEPMITLQPGDAANRMLAISAVLQVMAGWLFIVNTWSRVKER